MAKGIRVTSSDYIADYYQLDCLRYLKKTDFSKSRINRVLSYLDIKSSDVIADLGCGIGAFTIETTRKAKLVYAVDFSQDALDIVNKLVEKERFKNVITLKNSVTSLELRTESIDKVIAADLVEHLYYEQFVKFIQESNRILKPKGILCIYTPRPPSFIKGILKIFYTPLKYMIKTWGKMSSGVSKYDEEHNRIYEYLHVDYKQPTKIIKELSKRGFNIIKEVYFEIPGPDVLKQISPFARNFGKRTLIIAEKIS
ncbi:MAG: methyltransferase domain-containing protein [Candidatus Omnitrophota bacterium]|jgi:ubiquinone/menaquinone biosynthesis C-methylase UbiE